MLYYLVVRSGIHPVFEQAVQIVGMWEAEYQAETQRDSFLKRDREECYVTKILPIVSGKAMAMYL